MSVWAPYQAGIFLHNAGFTDHNIVIGIAVCRYESNFNDHARLHTSQEDSLGLMQINTFAHPQYSYNGLYDPQYNCNCAYDVYRRDAYSWRPWTTYTRGTYQGFMAQAQAAVNQMVAMGINIHDPGTSGAGTPNAPKPPAPGVETNGWDWSTSAANVAGHIQNGAQAYNDLSRVMQSLYM